MIVIAPAAPGDLPAAVDLLADVFVTDPVMAVVVGGAPDDRDARLRHLLTALLAPAVADGTVDLARRTGDPDVLGVACWEAPGAPVSTARLAARLPRLLRAGGPTGLLRAAHAKRVMDRHRPRRPHWYLEWIGVTGAARGLGVGAALLGARLAHADARDVPAYLESSTERNRRLYRRHGFVDVAPVRGLAGAAPMAMWRPTASERAAAAAVTSV
ncbi:GNAT family N-acetyltransferase [Cellulomonas sp. HD19AZ1]|uniref:GNAT family N-acetyltransferase n=1 Tax=Cellulomonas TaxID=1707 RepID=UPI001F10F78A|nr:GNAT family N-acetyltransferase [Cellulomonas sp. HD19AZ1]